MDTLLVFAGSCALIGALCGWLINTADRPVARGLILVSVALALLPALVALGVRSESLPWYASVNFVVALRAVIPLMACIAIALFLVQRFRSARILSVAAGAGMAALVSPVVLQQMLRAACTHIGACL